MIGAMALTICIVCPLVDLFDQWDHALQTGQDTEYPLVILALCVGAAFALGRLIIRFSPNLLASSIRYAVRSTFTSLFGFIRPAAVAYSSRSPPLSLRI